MPLTLPDRDILKSKVKYFYVFYTEGCLGADPTKPYSPAYVQCTHTVAGGKRQRQFTFVTFYSYYQKYCLVTEAFRTCTTLPTSCYEITQPAVGFELESTVRYYSIVRARAKRRLYQLSKFAVSTLECLLLVDWVSQLTIGSLNERVPGSRLE